MSAKPIAKTTVQIGIQYTLNELNAILFTLLKRPRMQITTSGNAEMQDAITLSNQIPRSKAEKIQLAFEVTLSICCRFVSNNKVRCSDIMINAIICIDNTYRMLILIFFIGIHTEAV